MHMQSHDLPHDQGVGYVLHGARGVPRTRNRAATATASHRQGQTALQPRTGSHSSAAGRHNKAQTLTHDPLGAKGSVPSA